MYGWYLGSEVERGRGIEGEDDKERMLREGEG